jgi:NAD(P)-dependent dehydrogenase (short-subunit alcohol dehydrogenase family)
MHVLVTGAASGIGRATCVRLARDAKARDRATRIAAVDVGPPGQLDDLIEITRS